MAAAVSFVVGAYDHLDFAVNCAAITLKTDNARRLPTAEVDSTVFDRIIAVDLRGMFLSLKFELKRECPRARMGRGSQRVVRSRALCVEVKPVVCSGQTWRDRADDVAALDYADQGIRVNAVAPGVTRAPVPLKDLAPDYEVSRGRQPSASQSEAPRRSE